MAEIDDLITSAAAEAAKAAERVDVTTRPVAARLDQEDLPPKILVVGHYATGKTELLLGPLLAGERLEVAETDTGSGLATIQSMLDPRWGNPRCLDRPDLLKSVYHVVLPTYKHFMEFVRSPELYYHNGAAERLAFDPTVSVWEGLSPFQQNYIDMEILKDEDEDPTEASLDEEDRWEYYRKLKRATTRAVDRFILMPGPRGNLLPKIITVLEGVEKSKDDKGKWIKKKDSLTGHERRGALIAGAAEALLMPVFDVVVEAFLEERKNTDPLSQEPDPPPLFRYKCVQRGDVIGKNRFGNLPEVMEADPVKFWAAIGGRK